MKILHSFCTSDPRKNTFSKAYADDLEDLLNKWGRWVGEHGNKCQTIFVPLAEACLFFPGVGSVAANERDSDDDSNEPERATTDAWMELLSKDRDGIYSLRPWNQVMEASKENLGKAMREYIRQAWSK